MIEQAHPPSEAQQLKDARTASHVAQVRIRELEAQVVRMRAGLEKIAKHTADADQLRGWARAALRTDGAAGEG